MVKRKRQEAVLILEATRLQTPVPKGAKRTKGHLDSKPIEIRPLTVIVNIPAEKCADQSPSLVQGSLTRPNWVVANYVPSCCLQQLGYEVTQCR